MADKKKPTKVSNSLMPKKKLATKKPIPKAEEPKPAPLSPPPIAAEETHKTTLRLNKKLHRAATIHCLHSERSLTSYVEELIAADLKKKNIDV